MASVRTGFYLRQRRCRLFAGRKRRAAIPRPDELVMAQAQARPGDAGAVGRPHNRESWDQAFDRGLIALAEAAEGTATGRRRAVNHKLPNLSQNAANTWADST